MYIPPDFKGVLVPYILIEKLGPVLALKVSAYYLGIEKLTTEEMKKCQKLGIGDYRSFSQDEAIGLLKKKNPQHLPLSYFPLEKCILCNTITCILHEHHYPIPKSKGGLQVILICANCHSEYHKLVDNKAFIFSDECLSILNSSHEEYINAK